MGLFGNHPRIGASAASDYEIERSLRFNPSDDAYLSRTFGTNSSNTTKTFSFWIKRSSRLGDYTTICGTTQDGNVESRLQFGNSGSLKFTDRDSSDGTTDINFYTTPIYRDCSAWYHIVLIIDTTNGTAGDRTRIYVNGSRVTDLSSVTNASLFEGNSFERVNAVVDPSAVNSSTVLSERSKLAATSPMNEPNILSVDTGAVLNTIVESDSIPYPTVGVCVSCGC